MHRSFESISQTIVFPEGTSHWTIPLHLPPCASLREAGVVVAGVSETPHGYLIERRAPGFNEILFTLEGAGRLCSGREEHIVPRGSAMLLAAGSRYRYETEGAPWRILWFHLSPQEMWEGTFGGRCHVRPALVLEELHRATEGLLAETMCADVVAGQLAETFASQIVLFLRRELHGSGEDSRERRFRQPLGELWAEVNAHLDLEWTVAMMAERMSMSPPHFFRVCRKAVGHSPMRMLFLLRMRRAEELLSKHDYPLKTIAAFLGYGSPFALSSAFRRHRGMSPKEFRTLHGALPDRPAMQKG